MGSLDPLRVSKQSVDRAATVDQPEPEMANRAEPVGPNRQYPADDSDPPTDPLMSPFAVSDVFDAFAIDTYRPESAWYRGRAAMAALVAIGIALTAIVVASALLMSGKWTVGNTPRRNPTPSTETTPTMQTTPGAETTPSATAPPEPSSEVPPAPATTPLTSPPPPPPAINPAPARPRNTYAPAEPPQTQENPRNITTPQTRPPAISVRPTHRPAFPGQPGEN